MTTATLGERVIAALDETLAEQTKSAADSAWIQVSAGDETIDVAVEKFMRVLDVLVELHEKVRAAAEKKFGVQS